MIPENSTNSLAEDLHEQGVHRSYRCHMDSHECGYNYDGVPTHIFQGCALVGCYHGTEAGLFRDRAPMHSFFSRMGPSHPSL